MWGPTQNLGQIGSAGFTFIGHKQTERQTRKVICIFLFLDAAPLPGAHNGAESSIIRSQSPGANPGIYPIVTYLYKY